MSKKLLSLLLALALVMAIFPAGALAEAEVTLWVNGVDIVATPSNIVACGSGTASYNMATKTLTLSDATITTNHMGCGIMAGSYFDDQELTVELIGQNIIMPGLGGSMNQGISIWGALNITGSGSLDITTCTLDENESTFGISAFLGCCINSESVTLTDTTGSAIGNTAYGIDVNASTGYFICDDATLQIDGYAIAVNVPSGRVNIDDSEIEITNAVRGINGGAEINNFAIKDSTVDCSVSGTNAVAIANGQDILIDSCEMVLSSTSSNAIYTDGAIKIKSGSDIDATGFYPALFGSTAITIENSEIKAVSTNDIGIFSKGTISLSGGKLYAKGGPTLAAIAARAVKSADEAAAAKIIISDLVDKNGAKTAFGDWFTHSSGQTRSWTTFIAKDASPVEVNASGGLMYAVNELWLEKTYAVTYNPNGGSGVMAAETATAGEPFQMPANDFAAPAGKQFKEWAIGSADSTTRIPAEGYHTFTADTAVYAIWEDIPAQLTAPVIGTQPENRSVPIGYNPFFRVVATGNPAPTYQWQVSADNGATWSSLVGETDADLVVLGVTLAFSGKQYRCVASNSQGTTVSQAATLTVTQTSAPEPEPETPPTPTPPTVYNDPSVPKATVWLSGKGISQSDSLITEPLTGGGDHNSLIKLADSKDILRVYDISLKSGKAPTGEAMTLTFDLGKEHAGQSLTLVHKKADGTLEYFHAAADADGKVSFGPIYELSPFMLLKGALFASAPNVPNTGDRGSSLWFAFTALGAAGVFLLLRRRRRKSS